MASEEMKCDLVTFSTFLLWIFLLMATFFHGAETEVASSVSVMTSLISQEEKLIDHLGKVLDLARVKRENGTWIARIERYLDCIEAKHRSIARTSLGNLAHPIIGFRLVRRLAKEWNDVTGIIGQTQSRMENVNALYDNLRGMKDVFSRWTQWPQTQDVKDTAMGLIRIGSTYDLYPATFHREDSVNIHILSKDERHLSQFGHEPLLSDVSFMTMTPLSQLEERETSYRCKQSAYKSDNRFDVENKCDSHSNVRKSNIHSHERDNENKTSNTNKIVNKIKRNEIISSNNPNIVNKEQSCQYSYTSFEFDDFVYIVNAAINQKLGKESQHWYDRLHSEFYSKGNLDELQRSKMDKLQRRIQGMKASGRPKTDGVMKKYTHLCREAAQVDSIPQTPVSPSLYCSWRISNPYLRYKVELLHTSPDIYQFHDVIAPGEIEHIKTLAKKKLVPSSLNIDGSKNEDARYWRVSQTAWFRDETPVLQRLSERVGHLTGLETGIITDNRGQPEDIYSEPLQVVNYGLGGLYGPHLDTLHSTNHKPGASKQHTGDRLATWMFYLGDVKVGGATVFPHINVSVKPIKGSAILWYNLLRNGQVDKRTVHAGCPVVIGDKWVANKWVRDTAQWKTRPCLLDPTL